MIGIYKITNKQNGKAYIGQSIHCGKRLDEHCKGNQLIDEVIQIEGIENFTFEILKEVNKQELSIWEDYYIMKFNTIFPNGYNKRWNCSEELRLIIFNGNNDNNNNVKISQEEKYSFNDMVKSVVILDEDIEILKRAVAVQKLNYNKRRICSIDDLQRFYYYGNKEAKERGTLSLKEIIIEKPEKDIISLSYFYQKWIKKIKDAINIFNSGKSTWTFYRGEALPQWAEKEYHKLSTPPLTKEKIEGKENLLKRYCSSCGCYNCGTDDVFYYKTCFIISVKVEYSSFKDIWLKLLEQNFINKEWIHFLDKDKNEIVLKKDIELEEIKRICYILVGKSIIEYKEEAKNFNNFSL